VDALSADLAGARTDSVDLRGHIEVHRITEAKFTEQMQEMERKVEAMQNELRLLHETVPYITT